MSLIDYFYRSEGELTGPFPSFGHAFFAVAAVLVTEDGPREIETRMKALNHWEIRYDGKQTPFEILTRGADEMGIEYDED